ncbi:survival motor neuron interacting protein 1-domain-containing protein [Amanita rubescens]|nr:survival motor neuron interacting protein 1-domain-containing protein [Amanita rubescens]
MASLKRKRDDLEESDDEGPSYGKQILPVANLPNDFDRPPVNGMEYLFTVRRDARALPDVARVTNPYELPDKPLLLSPANDYTPSHPALPTLEWRTAYKIHFCNFRKNLDQPTIHVEYTPGGAGRKTMPDKKDRDLWWAFLSGKLETEWNPPKKPKVHKAQRVQSNRAFAEEEETVLLYEVPQSDAATAPSEPRPIAREPVPSLLKCIDERTALHLLMYFVYWFNLYLDGPQGQIYQPTECHARWIFSLMARVDDRISGDDIALLRSLVRACIGILKTTRKLPENEDGKDTMRERSCWIIISTIVDIWEQRDLWMDAEEVLKDLG